MVEGAAALDGAAHGRVGRDGDFVAVQLEVRDQGAFTRHLEGVFRSGGDHCAVFGPVQEGVAFGSRGRQRALLEVVEGASALDGAAHGRVGRNGDLVAVQLEVGKQETFTRHREGVFSIRGDLYLVLRPVHEVITHTRRCRHRAALTMVVGVAATDEAALFGMGLDQDRIAVHREVRHQGAFARHLEGVFSRRGDFISVLGPVHEGVAFGDSSRHRAALTMVKGAAAFDGAAHSWVGRSRDLVAVQREVRHQGNRSFHREGVGGVC